MIQQIKTALAVTLLMGSAHSLTATMVVTEQNDVRRSYESYQNKSDAKHIAMLKTELAKMKAFKKPFAKFAEWGPTIFLGIVGFGFAYYSFIQADIYGEVHDDFLKELLSVNEHKRKMELNLNIGYMRRMINQFNLYTYMWSALGSLPWIAALINKWLDFSCQSYEQDIEEAIDRLKIIKEQIKAFREGSGSLVVGF